MARHPRLHRSTEVRTTVRSGRAAPGRVVVVHWRARPDEVANRSDSGRVTVVAGRKVGNAVQRNRAKRRLRAALEECDLPDGVDVVVVARRAAVTAAFDVVVRDLQRLLERVATARPGTEGAGSGEARGSELRTDGPGTSRRAGS